MAIFHEGGERMDKLALQREWKHLPASTRPNWPDFLANKRKEQRDPADTMQKAKLAFKHGMNTIDTTMERCILWQRAAFRK